MFEIDIRVNASPDEDTFETFHEKSIVPEDPSSVSSLLYILGTFQSKQEKIYKELSLYLEDNLSESISKLLLRLYSQEEKDFIVIADTFYSKSLFEAWIKKMEGHFRLIDKNVHRSTYKGFGNDIHLFLTNDLAVRGRATDNIIYIKSPQSFSDYHSVDSLSYELQIEPLIIPSSEIAEVINAD